MKAIRIHEDGGPEVLRYEDAPDPVPGPGRGADRAARGVAEPPRRLGAQGPALRAEAAHPRRRRRRRRRALGRASGIEPASASSSTPASSTATRITVIGEHTDGTHAELIAVPARTSTDSRPGSVSRRPRRSRSCSRPPTACSSRRRRLQEGEWVLVWGIGSGVAHRVARASRRRSARRSSSRLRAHEKLERARELGADATVNHETEDVAAARQGAHRRRRARRRRARRRGDVAALARRARGRPAASSSAVQRAGRTRRPPSTGSGGSSWPCSARRWARERISRVSTSSSPRAGAAGRRLRCSRSRRPRPRTSAWSAASSSARSSSPFPG